MAAKHASIDARPSPAGDVLTEGSAKPAGEPADLSPGGPTLRDHGPQGEGAPMSQLSDRIKEQNRRITERDPELAHEIDETRRELRETPPRTMAHIRAEPRTPTGALEGAAPPPPDRGELIAETIVRRKLRPVLAIKKGTADLVLNPADSQAWKTRLTRAKPVLIPAIRAVGRVEVRNHP